VNSEKEYLKEGDGEESRPCVGFGGKKEGGEEKKGLKVRREGGSFDGRLYLRNCGDRTSHG